MATKSLTATLDAIADSMTGKARMEPGRAWLLAMLAGAYIAMAGFGSSVASCNLLATPATYGLGKFIAGILFPIGLMLVVVAGGELFTGNCLMAEAWRRKRLTVPEVLRSWIWVYAGNFTGALIVSLLLWLGGAFLGGDGSVSATVIKTAAGKARLDILQCFCLGIFCNWLVCLAIWLATRTEEAAHKAFLLFFPIWLFVASGYEHSIANMYYLSAGLLAAFDPAVFLASKLPETAIAGLTFSGCLKNLLFVTLGNIVGGSVFVGMAYAYAYGKISK